MPLLLLRPASRATAMVSWGHWPAAASMGLAENRGSTMPLLQANHAQWSKTLSFTSTYLLVPAVTSGCWPRLFTEISKCPGLARLLCERAILSQEPDCGVPALRPTQPQVVWQTPWQLIAFKKAQGLADVSPLGRQPLAWLHALNKGGALTLSSWHWASAGPYPAEPSQIAARPQPSPLGGPRLAWLHASKRRRPGPLLLAFGYGSIVQARHDLDGSSVAGVVHIQHLC